MRVTRWFNMGHVLPTKWDIRPRLLGDLSATTAGSAQYEAKEVNLNMLTMLTVRRYSGYGD